MAVDSAAKRASVTHFLVSSMPKGVIPGGSVDQADRQDASWAYRGILAAVTGVIFPVLQEEGAHSLIFGGLVVK